MERKQTLDEHLRSRGQLPARRQPKQAAHDEDTSMRQALEVNEEKLNDLLRRLNVRSSASQRSEHEEIPGYCRNWSFDTIGTGYQLPWSEESSNSQFYRNVLATHGYHLNWANFIYKGEGGQFDHSVWIVDRDGEEDRYALKVVGLMYYKNKFHEFSVAVKAVLKEARILVRLSHPGIITVFEYISLGDPESNFPYNYIGIAMEYMEGTLQSLVRNSSSQSLEMDANLVWFTQIARALEYMHYNIGGLVVTHMAISPRNILHKILNGEPIFKLADFEECNIFNFPEHLHDQFNEDFVQYFGARPYLHPMGAPELASQNIDWSQLHARPTDVYSLGLCLAFGMFGGYRKSKEMAANIREEGLGQDGGYLELIAIMTDPNPQQRPTIVQVLQNDWVTGQWELPTAELNF